MQRGHVLRPPDRHQIVEIHDCCFLCTFAGQRRLDPVDLHSHVALGEADDGGDFLVAEAIEQQQGHGAVDVLELRDLVIQPLDARVAPIRRRRGQQAFHNLERLLAPLMPVLLARPRDRRVQGDAVHPRGHGGIAAERIHRAPDLNDDFLKEILAVGMLERIRVDHFEEDPFVARQPVAEAARIAGSTVRPGRASRCHCAASRRTTMAIISSRRSWSITLPGMRRDCEGDRR